MGNGLIHLMVGKTKLKRNYEESCNNQASASAFVVEAHTTQTIFKQTRRLKHMFGGLETNPQIFKQSTTSVEADEIVLRDDCNDEISRYMRDATDGPCSLFNKNESFNGPLKWWSLSASKYPMVDDLARAYIAISATSVPSERIWSRAARILSAVHDSKTR
jgi:hAT family C-terminal dimerisation region